MNKPGLLFLATCAASITALAAFSTSDLVSLRFVTAADARVAIEQTLGADAAAAVRKVDSANNGIALNYEHPQAAKVRAFLAKFDKRQAQVRVAAVITKRVEATADAPAHDEVILRPTLYANAGKPMSLFVPGGQGNTRVELNVTFTPGAKE